MKSKLISMSSARSSCSHRSPASKKQDKRRSEDTSRFSARQLAAGWQVRQHQTKLEKSAVRRQREVDKCAGYCP